MPNEVQKITTIDQYIAGYPAEDMRFQRQLEADRDQVVDMELEMPDGIGAGLEQKLGGRIQQHAGED